MNTLILAQATEAAAQQPNAIFPLIVPGLMLLGLWFLLIAPQRKRQKKQEQMISSLASGDEVLTLGGLYGTITNVRDDRFIIKIADNTKIEVNRAYIQSKVAPETAVAGKNS